MIVVSSDTILGTHIWDQIMVRHPFHLEADFNVENNKHAT